MGWDDHQKRIEAKKVVWVLAGMVFGGLAFGILMGNSLEERLFSASIGIGVGAGVGLASAFAFYDEE